MDRIARIAAGEEALDRARSGVDAFAEALDAFEHAQSDVALVLDYLGSEEWFDDCDAYEAGDVPQDVKAGILSEDLGYDLFVDNRDLAIRMLELAARMLKEL